jgi:hypothetical protein
MKTVWLYNFETNKTIFFTDGCVCPSEKSWKQRKLEDMLYNDSNQEVEKVALLPRVTLGTKKSVISACI